MENIAQVNAYSVWYQKDGKPASIVDCDSNVGNVGTNNSGATVSVDNVNFYEDTVYKTGIDIKVPNHPDKTETQKIPNAPVRTITGKVWDDTRSESITTDGYTQYLGNGIYNGNDDKANSKAKQNENVGANYDKAVGKDGEDSDILVRGAKAEYIEIVNVNGKYYEEKLTGNNIKWNPVQNARTGNDGTYTLSGFIPGYYIVRYSYGDTNTTEMLVFNGQDYKSTTYTGVKDWADSDTINEDERLYGMQANNKSDARDDEIRRLETIAYSETMVNKKAEVLKGIAKGSAKSIQNQTRNSTSQLNELINNASMHADTVKFYVKPEKIGDLTVPENKTSKKYNNLEGIIIYKDLDNLNYSETDNKSRAYEIQNIDFGIEYRPETQISLNKEISRVKLITSDGEELVNLALRTLEFGKGEAQEHEIIKEESTGLEYTQFVSSDYAKLNPSQLTSEDYQGFVFVNIETDVLQGCSIVIEYKFTAENDSEVDLINSNLNDLRYRQNNNENVKKVIKRVKKSFIPPTFDEVLSYAIEKDREDLAKPFYDYFVAGDWVDSKGQKVRSWKQKFLTWCGKTPKTEKRESSFDVDEFFEAALENTYGAIKK